jgi:hypothetical protein
MLHSGQGSSACARVSRVRVPRCAPVTPTQPVFKPPPKKAADKDKPRQIDRMLEQLKK